MITGYFGSAQIYSLVYLIEEDNVNKNNHKSINGLKIFSRVLCIYASKLYNHKFCLVFFSEYIISVNS